MSSPHSAPSSYNSLGYYQPPAAPSAPEIHSSSSPPSPGENGSLLSFHTDSHMSNADADDHSNAGSDDQSVVFLGIRHPSPSAWTVKVHGVILSAVFLDHPTMWSSLGVIQGLVGNPALVSLIGSAIGGSKTGLQFLPPRLAIHQDAAGEYSILPTFHHFLRQCLSNLGSLLLTALNNEPITYREFHCRALTFRVSAHALDQVAMDIPAPILFLFNNWSNSVRLFKTRAEAEGHLASAESILAVGLLFFAKLIVSTMLLREQSASTLLPGLATPWPCSLLRSSRRMSSPSTSKPT
ncbi:hypothetical protein R3P38DRAFT_3287812 [Favolaschia claudopus]|uniref:Uncharacterized protein n=1 Tax=Favolaschia claudopus TaxID=2862362 RepID=A0AAV9ZYY2_9AGAR